MSSTVSVALIEDDEALRESVALYLTSAGCAVEAYARAEPALDALDAGFDGVVVSDVKMPGLDGVAALAALRRIDAELPVILITAHGDVPMAVEAMRKGAYDFLEKPFEPDRLLALVRRAGEARRLQLENRRLKTRLSQAAGLDGVLVGESPAMRRLRETIADYAATDASLMILGETGVGKELVARCLHGASARSGGPFVAVNCAAVPETMFEAELFGHEAGAFTGAGKARDGYFQAADRGVLLLDELGSLPLAMQPKLLRALQEGEATRVGATRPRRVDIRVLSATNESVDRLRAEGGFRDDLFYRLNALTLRVPPLREREGDPLLLFQLFVDRLAQKYEVEPLEPSADDAGALLAHGWPGNVRELLHVAERYVLASRRGRAPVRELIDGAAPAEPAAPAVSLRNQVEGFERALIARALAAAGGDIAATCEALNMPRRTLNEKMVRYGLQRADYL